jgi:glycosyltransferase involved in cell wall biosynthesis
VRIAHLIDSLYWGGPQRQLVTFAAAARLRNLRPTIISLRSNERTPIPDELEALGAEVRRFSGSGALDLVRLSRLARFLRRERFDVLHTHLSYSHVVGAVMGPLAGLPVVSTQYNSPDDLRLNHPLRYQLETWALRHAARRVLAVGYTVAESNRERLKGKRLDVVLNAVHPAPALTPAERLALRGEMTGDPTRPILIWVGRLEAAKGCGDMLAAFAEVRRTHPSAALVIVGEGSMRASLAEQISALQLAGHAILAGARNDVPRLLASSDVFVSASHRDGLPVAILEAMAAGLPVVATEVGDVSRMVSPETGVVLPPQAPHLLSAALVDLLDQPTRRRTLGAAAQAYVTQHHSPAAWLDQLLGLYATVLPSSQASTRPLSVPN